MKPQSVLFFNPIKFADDLSVKKAREFAMENKRLLLQDVNPLRSNNEKDLERYLCVEIAKVMELKSPTKAKGLNWDILVGTSHKINKSLQLIGDSYNRQIAKLIKYAG